jgi:enhancing lycopene biosynthesis protein 2
VMDVKHLKQENFNSLIIPGGDGSIRNLCNYEKVTKKNYKILEDFSVHPEVSRIIQEFHQHSKMMILCAFSPLLACKILGTTSKGPGITVTYGEDEPKLKEATILLGNESIPVTNGLDFVFDEKNKIISTPLYNFPTNTQVEVYDAIGKIVDKL